MKHGLQGLAMKIFEFCSRNSIHLEVEWVPREYNMMADYFSKTVEKDDWGISFDVQTLIENRLGILEVDYFASDYNAKKPRFYSRLYCRECTGLNAFTFH